MKEKSKNIVNLRVEGSDFAKEMDSEDEVAEMEGVYFRDLMDLKEELEFDEEERWFQVDCANVEQSNESSGLIKKRRTAFDFGSRKPTPH